MSERRLERVLLKDIHFDESVRDLLNSPNMQPYIQMAMAVQKREGVQPCLETIAQMPLERRYVWRIASALKWAFGDFDSVSVAVDRDTLSSEDLDRVKELVRDRHLQLWMFLKTLVGDEELRRLLAEVKEVTQR